MAVKIILYQMTSEKNAFTKTLTSKLTASSAILQEPTSVTDPVLLIDGTLSTLFTCNYAYIDVFKRYYFINKMVALTTNLVEITCHVDVLYSFATEIKANTALLRRQSDDWNLYIPDNQMATFNSPSTYTKPFSAGFTGSSYVLSTIGAAGVGGSSSREFTLHISAAESSTAPASSLNAYMAMSLKTQPTPYAFAFATIYAPGTNIVPAVYENGNVYAVSTLTQDISAHASPYVVSKFVERDENGDCWAYFYQVNSGSDYLGQGLQLHINNDPTDPAIMTQYNMVGYYNYEQALAVKLEHTDTYITMEYKPHA